LILLCCDLGPASVAWIASSSKSKKIVVAIERADLARGGAVIDMCQFHPYFDIYGENPGISS
jgi:hypothetical protein